MNDLVEKLRTNMVNAADALRIDRAYSASVMSDAIVEIDRLGAENKRLLDELGTLQAAMDNNAKEQTAEDLMMIVRVNHFGDGMNEHITGPTTIETAKELLSWADGYIFQQSWSAAKKWAREHNRALKAEDENKQLREALERITNIEAFGPNATAAALHDCKTIASTALETKET